jgi:hypothetical protein
LLVLKIIKVTACVFGHHVRTGAGKVTAVSAQAKNLYGQVDKQIHEFLRSALHGDEWSVLCLVTYPRLKSPWCPFSRELIDPTAGLNALGKRTTFVIPWNGIEP